MDLSALKSRLAALQNPRAGQGGETAKTLWSPSVGKHQVRLVPSAYNKSNPFKELFFYYGIGNKNTMIALTNFGEKDPIVEFCQGLRKSPVREDWQLARKLEPKMRVYSPVIVRGEEELGVVLWGFGKQVYMDLLTLVEDEDVGDFTDPVQGRDITIDVLGKESTGLNYNTSSIRVKTKVTPLSTDPAKMKLWLGSQPDPMTQFKKYAYDEMKSTLMAHLNPEEDAPAAPATPEIKEEGIGDLPWEKEPPKSKNQFSLSTSKTDIDSKIDELFKFD
jgi:hypothetical protein